MKHYRVTYKEGEVIAGTTDYNVCPICFKNIKNIKLHVRKAHDYRKFEFEEVDMIEEHLKFYRAQIKRLEQEPRRLNN